MDKLITTLEADRDSLLKALECASGQRFRDIRRDLAETHLALEACREAQNRRCLASFRDWPLSGLFSDNERLNAVLEGQCSSPLPTEPVSDYSILPADRAKSLNTE